MNQKTKKLSTLGMLSALAIISVLLIRIPLMPAAPFLTYDPKDVVIVIGGFLFGPLAAFLMSIVVAFVEMITVSDTGIIGMLMNVIASSAFACSAAIIYKKMRTLKGAVYGLIAGWLLTTVVMVLWNYLIVPLYMEVPRHVVAGMLMPIFVPFNLIKGGLNAGFALLLYKPLKVAFKAAGMAAGEEPQASGTTLDVYEASQKRKRTIGIIISATFVILTCILAIWVIMQT